MDKAKTVREAIENQHRRLKSSDPQQRVVAAFFRSGEVGTHLTRLTDRQIGQLVFDIVWDELGLVTPAMAICNEAIERLFRSPAGARPEDERFNDLSNIPVCPECGDGMLHFIGLDEPDYDQCQTVTCGHKVPKGEQYTALLSVGLFDRIIHIIDKYIQGGTTAKENHG